MPRYETLNCIVTSAGSFGYVPWGVLDGQSSRRPEPSDFAKEIIGCGIQ
jgi:hypothetical protein